MHRALLLIGLVLATACDDGQEARPRPTTPTTNAVTTSPTSAAAPTTAPKLSAGPAPEGFVAKDATWVSTERGWVLGSAPCASPPCTSILETRDGGRSWAGLPAPQALIFGATGDCERSACVSSIRFANEHVGWVFGPRLFVTTDGGAHWSEEPSPPIGALEAVGGRVFRVVGDQPQPQCLPYCDFRVEEGTVGSSTWRPLPSPSFDGGSPQLMLEGPRLYVAAFHNPAGGAGDAHASLVRSLDSGRTWQKLDDPCGVDANGENDAYSFAAAPRRFLAVLCLGRGNSDSRFMVTSVDAGRTWSSHRQLPGGFPLKIGAGSSRAVSSWIAGNGRQNSIATTLDGGRTWKTALTIERPDGPTGPLFLGYQDDRTGRAIFGGGEIWTTRDGGLSWTATDFRS